MLGHLLVFTLYILTLTCLPADKDKAELCIDEGVEFNFEYASVGEPLYAVCPLTDLLERNNFSVTWVRIDSQTEITSDRQARVHQDEQYLKFIPAELHDSGFYQCIVRNSTNCIKKIRRVEVLRHDNGLCYNNSVMFRKQKPIAPSLTIECPHLDVYFGHKNVQVRWFKECQPLDLDSNRYSTSTKNLIIKDLSSQDSGNYMCEVSFVYNGVTYNMSRAIEYTILEQSEPEAVIIFPKNNIIDVELGAPLTLTCKVLFNGSITVFWAYDDTPMLFYTEDDRVVMGKTDQTFTEDGLQHFLTLNFTKVIEEDYNRQFYCHVWTPKNRVFMFYVSLKRPDPNFQGFLIAFFVSAFLVTVISIVAIRIYKVDVVLWYRSSCFVNKDHKDGKLYDAYIIYPKKSMGTSSYEMDIFVLKVLPEVLEKQCGYRLFISGRDDLPGQAMTDLVEETIAQSRRVIIILGNIFCEDHGDDFEQKIAMYDALIQNKIKVVLIEMEKIDYADMPESIKYLKQKQGAVRWKGKFTEAALSPNTKFWKNIRYQMPPAQRPSDKELHYIHSED